MGPGRSLEVVKQTSPVLAEGTGCPTPPQPHLPAQLGGGESGDFLIEK